MKHSKQISELMAECLEANGDLNKLHEIADSTCTTGYDNDGSTGYEIFENGVDLGRWAGERNIFFGEHEGKYCALFFVAEIGQTEDELVERIKSKLGPDRP